MSTAGGDTAGRCTVRVTPCTGRTVCDKGSRKATYDKFKTMLTRAVNDSECIETPCQSKVGAVCNHLFNQEKREHYRCECATDMVDHQFLEAVYKCSGDGKQSLFDSKSEIDVGLVRAVKATYASSSYFDVATRRFLNQLRELIIKLKVTCTLDQGNGNNVGCLAKVTAQKEQWLDQTIDCDPSCTNFSKDKNGRWLNGWSSAQASEWDTKREALQVKHAWCRANLVDGRNCTRMCASSPCKNGGTCTDQGAEKYFDRAYTCACRSGFEGHNCATDIDECASQPCKHNATCSETPAPPGGCKDSPGRKSKAGIEGICGDDRRKIPDEWTCTCPPGYQHANVSLDCHKDINECISKPCQNKAGCVESTTLGSVPVDAYVCRCLPGWQGHNCADDINECASDPCEHGANCTQSCVDKLIGKKGKRKPWVVEYSTKVFDTKTQQYKDSMTLYKCADFVANKWCDPDNGINGYKGVGFDAIFNTQQGQTKKVLADLKSPTGETAMEACCGCSPQGGLRGKYVEDDTKDTYACECAPGYSGDDCEVDINECFSHPCGHRATCVESGTMSSVPPNQFQCTCPPGREGLMCRQDKDECLSTPCRNNATCYDSSSTGKHIAIDFYICECRNGWTGANCADNEDECKSKPCKNGATCTDLNEYEYVCKCVTGFAGENCETDEDECGSIPCKHGGLCVDSSMSSHVEPHAYTCHCRVEHTGWNGTNCEINVDDCVSSPCEQNSKCVDEVLSYECNCHEGYSGTNCHDHVQSCRKEESHDCDLTNGHCLHTGPGLHSCECEAGFKRQDVCAGKADRQGTCDAAKSNNGRRFVCNDIPDCQKMLCQNGATCNEHVGFGSLSTTQFNCTCLPGYRGDYCETNIDECYSVPCKHDSTCTQGVDTYSCTCTPGWQGYNCKVDINECASNACQNGAVCSESSSANARYGVNMYVCDCRSGYAGLNCEVSTDECRSSPCEHGRCGTVRTFTSKGEGVATYNCSCYPGWSGYNCKFDINECLSSPCQNGAKCFDSNHDSTIAKDRYYCACLPGFHGHECQVNTDDCSWTMPRPARDPRASPIPTPKWVSVPGTSIKRVGPCENGGVCTDATNAFKCACPPGYGGPEGRCEVDVNECASLPCEYGAICVESAITVHTAFQAKTKPTDPYHSSSNCTKPTGSGAHCWMSCGAIKKSYAKEPLDLCGGCCTNKLRGEAPLCYPSADDFATGTPFSEVNNEDHQNTCDDFVAKRDNWEQWRNRLKPMSGAETLVVGAKIQNYFNKSNGIPLTVPNNTYTCRCQPGFQGYNCADDVDECLSNPCKNNATCVNGENSWACECPGISYQNGLYFTARFRGETCSEAINLCNEGNASKCHGHATCTMTGPGTHRCDCNEYYYDTPGTGLSQGLHCTEICASSPCQNGGTCDNKGRKYLCKCATGYSGSNCEIDDDECKVAPCLNGGTCTESGTQRFGALPVKPGTYICECAFGFGPVYNASAQQSGIPGLRTRCQNDINECSSAPCQNGATCTHSKSPNSKVKVGQFKCTCPNSGGGPAFDFEGEPGEQNLCSVDVDECSSNPCSRGTCNSKISEGVPVGTYRCDCAKGWVGPDCDQDKNECASTPCKNSGTCLDSNSKRRYGIDFYVCKCLPGFQGDNCETNHDDCASNPCKTQETNVSGTCTDGANAYTCDCDKCTGSGCTGDPKTGYTSSRGSRTDCSKENDECQSVPCKNAATCTDNYKSYSCSCDAGYSGANCETDNDECASNPCANGGTCTDGHNKFHCTCTLGWHGMFQGGPGTKCGKAERWQCGQCDVDHDECSVYPYPCQNQGQCLESRSKGVRQDSRPGQQATYMKINPGEFKCKCSLGHAGDFCQIETMVVTLKDGESVPHYPTVRVNDVASVIGMQYSKYITAVKNVGQEYGGKHRVQFELMGMMCHKEHKTACSISQQDQHSLIAALSSKQIKAEVRLDGASIWTEEDTRRVDYGPTKVQRATASNKQAKSEEEAAQTNNTGVIVGLLAAIACLMIVGVILVRKKISSGEGNKGGAAHVEMEVI